MNSTKSTKVHAASTSKPQREGPSRLRPTSSSKQQQPSSRVRIDTLTVSELRKYAHVVTVKNEEYKQRLKSAHEMFLKLQEAYQRLKRSKKTNQVNEEEVAVEEIEEVVVEHERQTSGVTPLNRTNRDTKLASVEKSEAVRRSTRKRSAYQSRTRVGSGSLGTPPSAVTASHLTIDLPASPGDLQLAALTDEEPLDEGEDESEKLNATGEGSFHTPAAGGTEATPPEAIATRKRMKSPAWETIQKKNKNRKHLHIGYERVPDPEDAVEGLKLFATSNPQLDEERAFKYLEVVRKQDERAKLPAGFCADCARFYRVYSKHGNFEEANAMAQRMCGHSVHQLTSRHRQRWQAPDSPEGYWHLKPPEPHS